jgi:hypothetical protein
MGVHHTAMTSEFPIEVESDFRQGRLACHANTDHGFDRLTEIHLVVNIGLTDKAEDPSST